MRRYGLRDDRWERMALVPGREGYVGVTAKDNHRPRKFFLRNSMNACSGAGICRRLG